MRQKSARVFRGDELLMEMATNCSHDFSVPAELDYRWFSETINSIFTFLKAKTSLIFYKSWVLFVPIPLLFA